MWPGGFNPRRSLARSQSRDDRLQDTLPSIGRLRLQHLRSIWASRWPLLSPYRNLLLASIHNRKDRMKIYIKNESTVIDDEQVDAWLPGFQRYTWHVRAYWPRTVTLVHLAKTEPIPPDVWQIILLDDADMENALGYHDYTPGGKPVTKAFMKTDLDYGYNPTVTITHEIAEMMADPYCSETFQFTNTQFFAKEICDPVEADADGYEINPEHGDTIIVSNFVTPAWFIPEHPGPVYDRKKLCSSPGELRDGGYMSVYEADRQNWTQVYADGANGIREVQMDHKGEHSRPTRYARRNK